MAADDRTLVDLTRRVLGVLATPGEKVGRWSLWTVPNEAGESTQTLANLWPQDLRNILLAEARELAGRAALRPAEARDARAAMHTRHCEERCQQELAERRADAADEEAQALLADVRAAFGEPEATR